MPVNVRIPTPLRKLTQNKDTVKVSATTIQQVVDDLERQFPGLKERLCDEQYHREDGPDGHHGVHPPERGIRKSVPSR